jgi:hypothetical protein
MGRGDPRPGQPAPSRSQLARPTLFLLLEPPSGSCLASLARGRGGHSADLTRATLTGAPGVAKCSAKVVLSLRKCLRVNNSVFQTVEDQPKPTGLEELLKDDQTHEGGQLLFFEFQGGQTAGVTINVGFSYFHLGWPLFQVGSCSSQPDPTLSGDRLPFTSFEASPLSKLSVNITRKD